MISRKKASELYTENWCLDFTNEDELSKRILALSSAGAYELCVKFDSNSKMSEIGNLLRHEGYDVSLYNGYPDILEISFG